MICHVRSTTINSISKSRVSVKKWIFIFTAAKTQSQPRKDDTHFKQAT